MSRHHVEVAIHNRETGETIIGHVYDEEFAILDAIKGQQENILRQYRERYPLGLRAPGNAKGIILT